MDLSTGRRVGYDIDSLLCPSTSNIDVDDDRRAIIRDRENFATFAAGNAVRVRSHASLITCALNSGHRDRKLVIVF